MTDENKEIEKTGDGANSDEQKPRPKYRPRYQNYRRPRTDKQLEQRQTPPEQKPNYSISIVIPAYNEKDSFRELYEKIRQTVTQHNYRYEIIIVDDGSTDDSARVLRDLRQRDNRIKVIAFRRNYGKSAALSVGFQQAKGDIIISMDADLQDDPAEIPKLINEINKGKDMVSGWKKKRYDPITKTIPSRFFNFVTSKLTGIPLHDFNCGLKAYKKEVLKEINVYGELHRFIPALAHWQGYSIGEVVVQHHKRKYGKTKFGVGRFWKGFLDLLTMFFTTRYMQRPLHLFGFWGLLFTGAGFAIDAYLVVEWILGLTALSNRPLFLGGILLMIVGVQFISIGLIGEMITKSRESKNEYAIKDIFK